MLFLIVTAACVATLLGGIFAIRLRDKLHLILGFSAGAVMAVAFFDLLPEALDIGREMLISSATIISVTALGFVIYMILDRIIFLHSHADLDHEDHHPHHNYRAALSAGSLSVHSLLDGIAIGFAFQVSVSAGAIVALAVLTHDFSDGINTVGLVLKNGGKKGSAMKWLIVDAVAPIVGAGLTLLFHISENGLAMILALFAGFFIYLGASDLIPESHHAHPKFYTTAMTLLGMVVLYVVIHLSNL